MQREFLTMWKEVVVAIFKVRSRIWQEELREIMEEIGRDNRSPGRYSKPGPPKCDERVLITRNSWCTNKHTKMRDQQNTGQDQAVFQNEWDNYSLNNYINRSSYSKEMTWYA
jgi:hypothetical protein